MTHISPVSQHYGHSGLLEKILSGLGISGRNLAKLKVDDLALVDEFHTRGRAATLELVEMINCRNSDYVLDVGCGLGGTTRFLAEQYGCKVEGIDLTEEYILVGKQLNDLVGLGDHISLSCGNALKLPYGNATFDIVLTQHAQMNIKNKRGFYSEIARVLRPNGLFGFHDVFRCSNEHLKYPVPWAEDKRISFLSDASEVQYFMKEEGLELHQWVEKTQDSAVFFSQVMHQILTHGLPPIGIHLLMGLNAIDKIENYLENLMKGRVGVFMGVAHKQSNS